MRRDSPNFADVRLGARVRVIVGEIRTVKGESLC